MEETLLTPFRDYTGTYREVYPDITGRSGTGLSLHLGRYFHGHQVPTDLVQQIVNIIDTYCHQHNCFLSAEFPAYESQGFWLCVEELVDREDGLPYDEILMEGFLNPNDPDHRVTYVLPHRNIIIPGCIHLTRTIRSPRQTVIQTINGGTGWATRPTLGPIPRTNYDRYFDYTGIITQIRQH